MMTRCVKVARVECGDSQVTQERAHTSHKAFWVIEMDDMAARECNEIGVGSPPCHFLNMFGRCNPAFLSAN